MTLVSCRPATRTHLPRRPAPPNTPPLPPTEGAGAVSVPVAKKAPVRRCRRRRPRAQACAPPRRGPDAGTRRRPPPVPTADPRRRAAPAPKPPGRCGGRRRRPRAARPLRRAVSAPPRLPRPGPGPAPAPPPLPQTPSGCVPRCATTAPSGCSITRWRSRSSSTRWCWRSFFAIRPEEDARPRPAAGGGAGQRQDQGQADQGRHPGAGEPRRRRQYRRRPARETPLPVLPKDSPNNEISVATQKVRELEQAAKELMTQLRAAPTAPAQPKPTEAAERRRCRPPPS